MNAVRYNVKTEHKTLTNENNKIKQLVLPIRCDGARTLLKSPLKNVKIKKKGIRS